MSLSDKSSWLMDAYEKHYYKKDVKQAIQELKEELDYDTSPEEVLELIDKIFGEELSK